MLYWPREKGGENIVPGKSGGNLQADELAHKIIDILSEMQAEDILLLDIRGAASFADYFVIASTGSERQMGAVLDEIGDKIGKTEGIRPMGREGDPAAGWVLLDYGDVIVHVFAPEQREFYGLEGLWAAAVPVVRIQ